MGSFSTRSAAALGVALLLASCAAPPAWQHPTLPSSQWLQDENACRAAARARVEEETRRDPLASDATIDSPHGGLIGGEMFRYEAARRVAALTADCMRAQGYTRL